MDTIFVSYYTDNKPYNVYYKNLENSLIKFNLLYEIVKKTPESLGYNWASRTNYKPILIQEMMIKHPDKKICWVDCDSIIVQYPTEILNNNNNYDISSMFHTVTDTTDYKQVSNGLILVKNNENGKLFVKKWIEKTKEYAERCRYNEQDTFFDTYKEINNINYGSLSLLKYCWYATNPTGDKIMTSELFEHVVIVQFQASRLKEIEDEDINYDNLIINNFTFKPLKLTIIKIKKNFIIRKPHWRTHILFSSLNCVKKEKNFEFNFNPTKIILKYLPGCVIKVI